MALGTQYSNVPTTKTNAGGIASLIVLVVVWAVKQWGHVDVPAEVGVALTGIIGYAASYFMPPGETDTVSPKA